ncbi:hypothetical protein BHE74_00054938 [Ensete ventricosum]|nr:hypothetical protein BHE74_00054938 [Ensete ventricosum]
MGAPRSAAKAPPTRKSTTLRRLFELDSVARAAPLPPPSADAQVDELLSSISRCGDLTLESPSQQQEVKRQQLSRVLSAVRCATRPLDDTVWPPLVSMLSANLFRPLPPPTSPCLPPDLFEEDGPAMSLAPSWPHLHIVYDILAALVASADAKALRKHLDRAFLRGLLALFQSEDPRERDRLKNVFHQLYSKLASDRSFMRKSMNNVLLRFVFDGERHYGIGELLEIWGSIINGFAVPLKEEHRLFLTRVLLPLHKPRGICAYHRQLSYCVSQFVHKEPGLGEEVVKGILKHWPVTNCQKEVLLLGELEDLLESLDPRQFEKLAPSLCVRIARCSNSANSQVMMLPCCCVAERALYVWNSERFVKMASQSWEQVLPGIVECIEWNLRWHWSKSVQHLTTSVKSMLEEMEPVLYSRYQLELGHKESVMILEGTKRKIRWERLEEMAGCSRLTNQT